MEREPISSKEAFEWLGESLGRVPVPPGDLPVAALARIVNMDASEIVRTGERAAEALNVALGGALTASQKIAAQAMFLNGYVTGWVARQGGGPELPDPDREESRERGEA